MGDGIVQAHRLQRGDSLRIARAAGERGGDGGIEGIRILRDPFPLHETQGDREAPAGAVVLRVGKPRLHRLGIERLAQRGPDRAVLLIELGAAPRFGGALFKQPLHIAGEPLGQKRRVQCRDGHIPPGTEKALGKRAVIQGEAAPGGLGNRGIDTGERFVFDGNPPCKLGIQRPGGVALRPQQGKSQRDQDQQEQQNNREDRDFAFFLLTGHGRPPV